MSKNYRIFVLFAIVICLNLFALAQSKPQKPTDNPTGSDKKNQRPDVTKTEEERRKEEELRKQREKEREDEKSAVQDTEVLVIQTNTVNVDTVVYNKKTGQILTNLKKENFAIFDNGVKQEVTNFATPEAPITVSLVMEYSKWSEIFGTSPGSRQGEGKLEVIRPVAFFLSNFIKPPNDYASVIAFDIRPTPITDFTNDPRRIQETIQLLLRNNPAFRENNLFDAMKFALLGGKADTVVLENSKEKSTNYAGMTSVKAKRRAIILVASGIDTFSKTRYDEIRKIVQEAGIPFYIISTGNLFFKLYENQLDPSRTMPGMPDRLTFLQAQNAMNTFAKESGGVHYAATFESEIPDDLRNINAFMRSQYSLAFDAGDNKDGKKHSLKVSVDVDLDGKYDDKDLVVQHRPFYFPLKK
jgi:Ca-activated chloride channel homolog